MHTATCSQLRPYLRISIAIRIWLLRPIANTSIFQLPTLKSAPGSQRLKNTGMVYRPIATQYKRTIEIHNTPSRASTNTHFKQSMARTVLRIIGFSTIPIVYLGTWCIRQEWPQPRALPSPPVLCAYRLIRRLLKEGKSGHRQTLDQDMCKLPKRAVLHTQLLSTMVMLWFVTGIAGSSCSKD